MRCPTLILWGEEDQWLPIEHGLRLSTLIPSARFKSVPGLGHLMQEDAPEAVIAAIDGFISRTDSIRHPTTVRMATMSRTKRFESVALGAHGRRGHDDLTDHVALSPIAITYKEKTFSADLRHWRQSVLEPADGRPCSNGSHGRRTGGP